MREGKQLNHWEWDKLRLKSSLLAELSSIMGCPVSEEDWREMQEGSCLPSREGQGISLRVDSGPDSEIARKPSKKMQPDEVIDLVNKSVSQSVLSEEQGNTSANNENGTGGKSTTQGTEKSVEASLNRELEQDAHMLQPDGRGRAVAHDSNNREASQQTQPIPSGESLAHVLSTFVGGHGPAIVP